MCKWALFVPIEEDSCCYAYLYYCQHNGLMPHPIQPGKKNCNCALPPTHGGVWTDLLTAVVLR